MKLSYLFILIFFFCFFIQCKSDKFYWQRFARPAPFCVTTKQDELKNFHFIIERHNRLARSSRYLIPTMTTPVIPDHESRKFHIYKHVYDDFTATFTRINLDHMPKDSLLYNLRQHIHIHISSKTPLKALYIQSIASPMGLPFGQFDTSFDCQDCGRGYKVTSHMKTTPCKFRSFHSIMHPNVAVIGGEKNTKELFTDAHVHFHWSEGKCQEVALMQFFFVAVKNFANTRSNNQTGIDLFYSQVLNNTVPDSIDGVAFPVYPDFHSKIICHPDGTHKGYEPLKAIPFQRQHVKITYNKDFDDCVKSDGLGSDGKYQCPPGPLGCKKPNGLPVDHHGSYDTIQERILFYSDINTAYICPECNDERDHINHDDFDLQEGDVLLQDLEDDDIDAEKVTLLEQDLWLGTTILRDTVYRVHTIIMIFAWVTCPLLSNFLVRFYKESGHLDKGYSCGLVGAWLWGHIVLSYISLTSMLAAIGCLIFYQSECKADTEHENFDCSYSNFSHQIFGLAALIFFHVNQVNGFCRPIATTFRQIFIWWHFLFGYGQIIFGAISFGLVYEKLPSVVIISILLMYTTAIPFYVFNHLLQIYSDKSINEGNSGRGYFPLIEAIAVPKNYPLVSVRVTIGLLFSIMELSLFCWMIVGLMNNTEY